MKIKKPELSVEALENDFENDLSVVTTEFEKRAKTEQARYDDATNSRFYLCLVFQTQEQMLEFSEKSKISEITDSIIVDGMKFAKKIGVELTSEVPPVPKIKKNKSYEEFV